jgi:thioredoxin-like negative regulator of GroEL
MRSLFTMLPSLMLVSGCESASKPTIFAFQAKWCYACHADESRLTMLERQGYVVKRIDVDANPDMAREYGIESIPAYFLNGQRVSLP